MSTQPIGIFDSGIGGTSIFQEVHKLLPSENIIYLADSANAPYGNKSQEDILNLSIKNTLKEYILIDELSAIHSGVKASQGSFSLPFDGWIVKNGKKTSIEAATVAGDILNVLNSIVKIEEEQIVTHQGISPHIWVENISITGEA